jgi:predicted nucleotidyltransferase
MVDALRRALEAEPDVAYALLFGSAARGTAHAGSDADVALAYRIFRDGHLLVERDHGALVARKARAILDHLDFKPVEDLCAAGVLRAAARGR